MGKTEGEERGHVELPTVLPTEEAVAKPGNRKRKSKGANKNESGNESERGNKLESEKLTPKMAMENMDFMKRAETPQKIEEQKAVMRGLLSNQRVLEARIGRALEPAFAAINPPMTSHQKEIKMVMIFRNRLETINKFIIDIPDLKLVEQKWYLPKKLKSKKR